MGLLDGNNPALNRGLLAAGLALMGAKGKLGPALSQAGLTGLMAGDQYADQKRRAGMQDWQIQQQKVAAERATRDDAQQQHLRNLPRQFMMPGGSPGMDATGGMETAPEAPNNMARPQGFNMPGFIEALRGIDPMLSLQYEAATKKAKTAPVPVGAGTDLYDTDAGKVVYSNPKEAPADKTPEALRALELIYGKGSPEFNRAARQYADKMTTHAPAASMHNYGSPVAGIDPKTGQPAFAVTSKAGDVKVLTDIAPPAKEVPASVKTAIAENNVALKKIDDAIALIDSNGKSLGAQNYVGDAIMQRVDPEGVDVRAAVSDVGSLKLHDRSGANVTISEAPRLKPFIPLPTDAPAAARKKLVRFKTELSSMQQELAAGAGIREAAGRAGPKAVSGAPKTTQPGNLTQEEAAELADLKKRLGR